MFDDNQLIQQALEPQESTETQETQPQQPQVQQTQEESSQAKNFRALREAKEKAERERDEALRFAQELKQAQPKQPEEDDTINLGPDDLAEGKHLSKVDRKIKKLEEQLKQYQQQTTALSVEQRLKNDFRDIEKVVTKENIAALQEQYPEVAQTLSSSTDPYAVGSAAYTLIKKLGIYQEDNFEAERERAQKNASKPRPLTSVSPQQGDSPLSRANAFANGLTDDLRKQLLQEMNDSRKNN